MRRCREEEQKQTAHAIAVGALRFFLLKFTRNAIIAFDFKDALSFEGETGPYCQYAVVRIRGIRRKGAEAGATNVEVTAGIRQCAACGGGRKLALGIIVGGGFAGLCGGCSDCHAGAGVRGEVCVSIGAGV